MRSLMSCTEIYSVHTNINEKYNLTEQVETIFTKFLHYIRSF